MQGMKVDIGKKSGVWHDFRDSYCSFCGLFINKLSTILKISLLQYRQANWEIIHIINKEFIHRGCLLPLL
jgi:hypothetical protein